MAITIKIKFSELTTEADAAAINFYVWAWVSFRLQNIARRNLIAV